jgi:endogenous inhibitor of DNA gyrase (YacG/DUF329 family)
MPRSKERVMEVPVSFVRRLRLEDKTCPTCGKKFEGVKKRKYCSRACQAKADYEKHTEQYRKARMEKYYAEKQATAGKK